MGSGKVDGESLVAGVVPPVVTTRSGEGGQGDVSRRGVLYIVEAHQRARAVQYEQGAKPS